MEAVLFAPELCAYEPGDIAVDIQEGDGEGRTLFSPAVDGRHRVARTVAADRFFAHYFAVTGG